ncbi:MAG: TVP38/TMEM64 family protein [Actinobacteria bacterium]|nr:TVP38/TMEM64 family protein [Actinomycetota bacterium]
MTESVAADRFPKRRWGRLAFAGVAWVALVAGWVAYQRSSGLGQIDTAQRLIDTARGNWWAIGAYMAVSLIRPLVLFPATIVAVAAGILFGPVVGVVVAAGSANASAFIGYSVGRNLRRPGESAEVSSRLGVWASRLRANSFETVLLTRLLFLPYDLVNYGCGLLRVRRVPFVAATAIGTLPGTVAFVLVGSSVTRLDDGIDGIDSGILTASIVLILFSLATSRFVKRRTSRVAGEIEPFVAGDQAQSANARE